MELEREENSHMISSFYPSVPAPRVCFGYWVAMIMGCVSSG